MLPARLLFSKSFSSIFPCQLTRNLSFSPVQRMPFAKHEIVPDVIPIAPSNIARVNYVSGGDYLIFKIWTFGSYCGDF